MFKFVNNGEKYLKLSRIINAGLLLTKFCQYILALFCSYIEYSLF